MNEIAVPVATLYTGTTLATCSHKIIMIKIKFFSLLTIICLNFFQCIKFLGKKEDLTPGTGEGGRVLNKYLFVEALP